VKHPPSITARGEFRPRVVLLAARENKNPVNDGAFLVAMDGLEPSTSRL
jgi:hypothetical protein